MRNDTAILITSFGTTHKDALYNCIEAVEDAIKERFPSYPVYRAFTSGMVIRRLMRDFYMHVDTVSEALLKIKSDDFSRVVIQPTLLIPGVEYELMESCAKACDFIECVVSKPLLCCREDCAAVAKLIMSEYKLNDGEALVLMGHGTAHSANAVYGVMQSVFDEGAFPAYLTTVEGTPDFADTVGLLASRGASSAVLVPFLFVAGEHVKCDMAGDDENSLLSLARAAGIAAKPVLRGLGELPSIRERYAARVDEALRAMTNAEVMSGNV